MLRHFFSMRFFKTNSTHRDLLNARVFMIQELQNDPCPSTTATSPQIGSKLELSIKIHPNPAKIVYKTVHKSLKSLLPYMSNDIVQSCVIYAEVVSILREVTVLETTIETEINNTLELQNDPRGRAGPKIFGSTL